VPARIRRNPAKNKRIRRSSLRDYPSDSDSGETNFGGRTSSLFSASRLSARSDLAEVLRYIIKRRVALTRFATDTRLEPDNNIAENAIRGIAVTRSFCPYRPGS
jgi:hypothetical protein